MSASHHPTDINLRQHRAKKRNKLPKGEFALPSKRKYPIHDKAHARNALSRANQGKTEGSPSTIRRKVLQKYPDLKQNGGTKSKDRPKLKHWKR